MFAIFSLIKGNPWVFVSLAVACFAAGLLTGNRYCAERNTNAVIDLYQQGNDASHDLQDKKSVINENERKVVYVKKYITNDCLVDADRVRRLNAALTNDTSGLDR